MALAVIVSSSVYIIIICTKIFERLSSSFKRSKGGGFLKETKVRKWGVAVSVLGWGGVYYKRKAKFKKKNRCQNLKSDVFLTMVFFPTYLPTALYHGRCLTIFGTNTTTTTSLLLQCPRSNPRFLGPTYSNAFLDCNVFERHLASRRVTVWPLRQRVSQSFLATNLTHNKLMQFEMCCHALRKVRVTLQ